MAMTPEEKKLARQQKEKERIRKYAQEVVATFPPLTQAQLDYLAAILDTDKGDTKRRVPPRPIKTASQIRDEKRKEIMGAMHQVMGLCRMCDLEEKVHFFQRGYGTGFHDFIPLTPADIAEVGARFAKEMDDLDAMTDDEILGEAE